MDDALLGTAPSPIGAVSDEPRTTSRTWDITAFLTVWLVLLYGIPATQRIGPLGALGVPALLFASFAAAWWAASRFVPAVTSASGVQPLRGAMLGWLWYQLATIVIAHTRSLTGLEQSASAREAIVLTCTAGLALAVMDGVTSFERLETLMRRLVWGVGGMATVGLLQFVTGHQIVFALPGLSTGRMRLGLASRSIFNRPYGTALHPIEFSVMLASLLPLALYVALEAEQGSKRQRWAIAASVAIALGIPLSISRSGFVTFVAAMGLIAFGWTWRRRLQAGMIALMAVPFLWMLVPGLVGTIRGMFVGLEDDASIQGRIEDVPRVFDVIREYPWFGLGAGTFSVDDYFLVDNQFWVSTMETGIVGIVLLFALILLAIVMAVTSRHHRLATPRSSHLGFAIAAGILGLTVSLFTFDALFYSVLRGTLFLLIGAAGALWRLTRDGEFVP